MISWLLWSLGMWPVGRQWVVGSVVWLGPGQVPCPQCGQCSSSGVGDMAPACCSLLWPGEKQTLTVTSLNIANTVEQGLSFWSNISTCCYLLCLDTFCSMTTPNVTHFHFFQYFSLLRYIAFSLYLLGTWLLLISKSFYCVSLNCTLRHEIQ